MRKKFISLVGIALATMMLVACGGGGDNPSQSSDTSTHQVTKYTVAFEVDGSRVKTCKVNEGSTITETVADPTKDGFDFVGWFDGTTKVDLATYVVTKSVTLTAHFEEKQGGEEEGPTLSVDDVKEADKTYFLVLGWWETTKADTVTSSMTKETTRLFYGNLIKYLEATGASEEDIANISFRNYSSEKVADMGALVLADGDVCLLVGVGNNVNTDAGLSLYNSSNEYKFATSMGSVPKSRYVALLNSTNEKGLDVYEWLKTDTGKASFLRELTDDEIQASLAPVTINLTVTVHGDTDVINVLEDEEAALIMPEITVPSGKLFKGFATSQDGELVLEVAKDATLKYDDLKSLVAEGANTLELFPVFAEAPVVEEDLVVAIQINGSNLTAPEAQLMALRFEERHPDKNLKFEFIEGGSDAFKEAVNDGIDVFVCGNNPATSYTLYDSDNYPIANAGSMHFASSNRKVVLRSVVQDAHLDLAKDFYSFATSAAPEYTIHAAVWTKGGSWVTTDEKAALTTSVNNKVNELLGVVDTEALLSKYNVKVVLEDVVTEGNKVADLGAATNALRDGKGTDLVIGCGDNVATTGNVSIVEKQSIDISIVAADRKVALVNDNIFTRTIYENCFTVSQEVE